MLNDGLAQLNTVGIRCGTVAALDGTSVARNLVRRGLQDLVRVQTKRSEEL